MENVKLYTLGIHLGIYLGKYSGKYRIGRQNGENAQVNTGTLVNIR